MTDADIGMNGEVDFSVDSAAASLFSVLSTGPLSCEVFINHTLDREANSSYTFNLFATDRGLPPQTGRTTISITITVS